MTRRSEGLNVGGYRGNLKQHLELAINAIALVAVLAVPIHPAVSGVARRLP
jgi:hypothetical protein